MSDLQQTEQELLERLSRTRLMEVTRGIARFERLSGSSEERQSFEYVKGLLDEAGIPTRLMEHDAYISLPGPARIEFPEGAGPECYTTSFGVTTPAGGVAGELVYCGAGAPADYEGKDLRGKIVLLDGLPAAPKAVAAEAAGAIGQINIAGQQLHWMIISPVWGSPTREQLNRLPKHPCVTIRSADGERLKERLQAGPLTVRLFTQVETGWRKIPLLVADIPGKEPDFVLLSGHLDSWAYGAMDNGTANAAMVELARLFWERRHQLQRSVRVAFWSGHSHGRYAGSAWYADNHWEELQTHCICHLNVDSLGAKNATIRSEALVMAETKALATSAVTGMTGEAFEGRRVGRMGDQSFMGAGVPSLFMSLSEQPPSDDVTSKAMMLRLGGRKSGGLGWWWHTAHDTLDKIDAENLLLDARIYAAVLWRLTASPVLPLSVAAGAADWVRQLTDLQKAAGDRFSLARTLERAQEAAALATQLQQIADETSRLAAAGEPDAIERASAINHTLLAVMRPLIRAAYSSGSEFEHDPALPAAPMPGLAPVRTLAQTEPDSDAERFLQVELVRARNRAEAALATAIQAAAAGLLHLKEERRDASR